ncbi:MAG: type IX secretion system protein PorQ [Bacteroidales bacterium]|jgi:hypothetical protein|nr:type IX secretion system protein PorQ [Bacteroidales bacterium]
MRKKSLIVVIISLSSLIVQAQKGGSGLYGFLNNFNSNAKSAALGMDFVSAYTNDLNFAMSNPSLLSDSVNNDFSLTYTDIFAGINQYALAYSHTFKSIGSFGFGLQYLDYGSFTSTEANGYITSKFYVSDYVFNISWGRQLDENVFIGASAKPIFSQYESYSAFALAFDIAATYISSNRSWGATLMIKNFGKQLKQLYSVTEDLPFNVSLGVSKKLKYAPLTLYATLSDINNWDLMYKDALNDEQNVDLDGNIVKKEDNAFLHELDNAFRHLIVGVNFKPSKHFDISLGYSWRRNREMAVADAFSLTGFSYGCNIYIKRFTISYARSEYHIYGSPNYITLSVKI